MGFEGQDGAAAYGSPISNQRLAALGREGEPAGTREWRTPPLWGVASSPPYMHHGFAPSLVDAIRDHGGEAEATRDRFFALPSGQRAALIDFLGALRLPSPPEEEECEVVAALNADEIEMLLSISYIDP